MGAILMAIGLLSVVAVCVYLVHILERSIARSRTVSVGPEVGERQRRNAALHREIGRALDEERTLRDELRDLEQRQEGGRR